ncbi:MAG: hypothetical protein RLZZ574_1647 [Cyanobacteriota bacterium]|jgi:ribosomal protein S12 methylthiotransferase accessory factor
MSNIKKFKDHFHVECLEDDRVFLLSEKNYFVLNNHLYYLLAPFLDGSHTVNSIVDQLKGKTSAAEIYYALMSLESKGYVVEADDETRSEHSAFWNFLDIDSKIAKSRLQSTKVTITSLGEVSSKPFISLLESLNIQIDNDGDFTVVLTDNYLRAELEIINQEFLNTQRPWMLVKPIGTKIWIGPIFSLGKTGCWACLSQRLRMQQQVESFIQEQKGVSTPLTTSLAILPSTLQTALSMAATEVAKWVACGENKRLEGNLVTFDAISLETQTHTLVKRPQCPCCGEPKYHSNRALQPLILESRQKTFTKDGGHRSVSPEETLRNYQHHISPITGIVGKLKRSFDVVNNGLTHAYSSGQNLALAHENFQSLHQSLRSRSAGKGMSNCQAQVSCLCETLERYSGVFQGDEIRKRASYKQMGKLVVHPNTCMNFSEEQYKNRQNLNANLTNGFHWVPVSFDEEMEIDWTPVWSLTHKQFKYLPTAYCYYGYPIPDREKDFCHACSNGNAAGNTLEEAIFQGFLELVERDNVCLWWYNRIKRPAVNLESFEEPYISSLKEHYKTIQRDLWVLDLTSDLNIPTFVAISRRTDKTTEDILLGFGSHFDAKVAVLRAITELNQFLPAVLSMTADSYEDSIQDADVVNWWKTATLENQPYLVPDENTKPRLSSDYPQLGSDDLLKDVMTCVEIAKQNGMEMLVLDQTRPDVELNVVKVIVPGMRHFWARFGDGRLYDVPVKLGWLKEPLNENQLNPIPLFA